MQLLEAPAADAVLRENQFIEVDNLLAVPTHRALSFRGLATTFPILGVDVFISMWHAASRAICDPS